jgi:hypothetical protein
MKYKLLIAFSVFVAVAGTSPARAQVVHTIVADIPFSFTVKNKVMPAGEYTVKRVSSDKPGVMEIRSSDGHERAVFLVRSTQLAKEPSESELVFDRVGEQYFLSEIFESWDNLGVQLQKSHAEKKLEKTGVMIQPLSVTVPGQDGLNDKK